MLTKQAAQCFADKNYDMAATYYAKTSMSFEEITLKVRPDISDLKQRQHDDSDSMMTATA